MIKENIKHKTLKTWVEQYSDQLYAWTLYKTRSKETAEDLVQETFFLAIKSYEKCLNKDKAKTWLFAILNNKIIDFYRKSAKTWHHTEAYEQSCIQTIDSLFDQYGNWTTEAHKLFSGEEKHLLDRPEFNELLEKCLNDLPEKWKIAILSKYIYNKKAKEICQELDITPSNYWQVLHRAKKLLKICLEKQWNE